MRKESRAMQSIRRMYGNGRFDLSTLYQKTKLLLSIYRDVVWTATREADLTREEAQAYPGRNLQTALTYLSEFAPEENRRRFEEKVTGLFETQWMVSLVDAAMLKVHDYPNGGKLYHEILSLRYLSVLSYSETEALETLNIERSVYYERKREAISLLGYAIWGYAIPMMKGILSENIDLEDAIPAYFRYSPQIPDEIPIESRRNPDKVRTESLLLSDI